MYNLQRFAIYGAQVVAYGFYRAIKALYGKNPLCFLVSNLEGNPRYIEDIEVRCINNCNLERENTLIVVAITELLQDKAVSTLKANGFSNIIRVNAHCEHLVMSKYFNGIGSFPLLKQGKDKLEGVSDFVIYEVKNHRDAVLSNPQALQTWERSIQAGAALVPDRIAAITDDTGDNISHKNRMYSEMTATYWVWKNTAHKWKGICHYRRHLILSPYQLSAVENGRVDALLPLPYLCYPSSFTQLSRFVSKEVIEVFFTVLELLHPTRFLQYKNIINDHYQYTYNLVCARAEVFDDYCAWVFPILEQMEHYGNKVSEIISTRALSYIAEVLTSIYFLSNSKELKIRHIEKAIYT